MKKCLMTLLFLSLMPLSVSAQMNPRVKALLLTSAYGTAGGALLGTASLAFGSGGRSVARGASLGLYAGIGFGVFIIASHAMRQHRLKNPSQGDDNYYPDSESPYEEDERSSLFGLNDRANGQKWNGNSELLNYHNVIAHDSREQTRRSFDFVLPVVHMSF